MPGPRPLPNAVLAARGSRLARNRPTGPAPEPGEPKCPDWLSPSAKAVWCEVVPLLVDLGVLSPIDGNALARYCIAFSEWHEAMTWIREHGLTYQAPNGLPCPYPQVGFVLRLEGMLAKLEEAFGMTPTARVRLGVANHREKLATEKASFFRVTD